MLCVQGSPLYQWDINRQLKINSIDTERSFTIHCCHKGDANALVVEPIFEGDGILVNIPNILLQRDGHLRVYVVVEGDTIYDTSFYVMARPKPDDYVYTETEVRTWEALDERVSDLEKGGGSGGGEGADGGYYTPSVTQPFADTMVVSFTPSDGEMPSVDPVNITLPKGEKGDDYVLTDADKVAMVEAVLAALPNGDEVSY